MTLLTILAALVLLILLIAWLKINPFLAFLLTSITAAMLLKIPIEKIPTSLEKGIGSMLGSLTGVLCIGAMFGKLVSESGAAQKIANVLMSFFGERYIQWALMLTGFIVGIPLFYNVGFVLFVPLIFSVAFRFNLPAVAIGLPLLTSLSVTHGFLPPHPSPTALVAQFSANLGTTLFYGILVAIPTVIIAGPIFASTLKNIVSKPLATFTPKTLPDDQLPGTANCFLSTLLPVILLAGTSLFPLLKIENQWFVNLFKFLGDPLIVMLIALLVGTFTLGIFQNRQVKSIMENYGDAVKDIAMLLLILAGAGTLKQVFVDGGVSQEIATMLNGLKINPLLLGWMMATVIRICIGSATVAGITTAGIIAPVVAAGGVDPNLMVLAVGAGSLMFSHVNDSGFWMFKEYFNLSLKDTYRSWSLMETVVGVVGILSVLVLDIFV